MAELKEFIQTLKPSIVVVKTADGGSGTGLFLNNRGLFITNKHVVKLYVFVKISGQDGQEKDATVVCANNDVDFAFAVADGVSSTPAPLGDSESASEGEEVLAIGNPYGYDFSVSRGIVSCRKRKVKGINYIQTDVPINPGNSGGPLINARGEVIGINTWAVKDAENMGFAIPSNSFRSIFETLHKNFDSLLSMYYCEICGHISDAWMKTAKAEYCENCGALKVERKKPEATQAQAQTAEQAGQPVKVAVIACLQCKTQNDAAANFCQKCGFKLKS